MGKEEIGEVKYFNYLGYHFQKNGGTELHMREAGKETMIAMKQVWGIGMGGFKNNFERRLLIPQSGVEYRVLCRRNMGMEGGGKI